jgi:2-methylcitrate dehydratase PrpD
MAAPTELSRFIHETSFHDLPPEVVAMSQRCCLDVLGVAVAGRTTDLSRIITDHARRFFGTAVDPADILFTGTTASAVGAALAGGMTVDAFDAHDGHRLTKGHAGAAVVPAVLAVLSSLERSGRPSSGRELLAALAVGYEVALRAGIALHATADDYHTSGAWNALGVAAAVARLLRLDADATRHALGIAEYHGPRSQMMRCIDHPTMVKDGSGWGAMVGVSSACLAEAGFTGAPAVTVEAERSRSQWQGLGRDWRLLGQYFKPYPVCRWAQPAVQAVRDLVAAHRISPDSVANIEVDTFHEAVRLAGHAPATTEEAQYAIAFPVAAMLVRGRLGAEEVSPAALRDPDILSMSRRVLLREADRFNRLFPAERWAEVTLTLTDGRVLRSAPTAASGDPEDPLSDDDIRRKFEGSCAGLLPPRHVADLQHAVAALAGEHEPAGRLLGLVRCPVATGGDVRQRSDGRP